MKQYQAIFAATLLGLPIASAWAASSYVFDDIVHMSCVEAWQYSGENTENIIAMVEVLASHSLNARNMTFPDTEEAGRRLGELIEKGCDERPQDLFYNEVDTGIRLVVTDSSGE